MKEVLQKVGRERFRLNLRGVLRHKYSESLVANTTTLTKEGPLIFEVLPSLKGPGYTVTRVVCHPPVIHKPLVIQLLTYLQKEFHETFLLFFRLTRNLVDRRTHDRGAKMVDTSFPSSTHDRYRSGPRESEVERVEIEGVTGRVDRIG